MSIGILLVAEPAVAILLGDKGIPAVPFVQVLVLHGAIRSCSTGAMPAFMVLNKPHINTQFTLSLIHISPTHVVTAQPGLIPPMNLGPFFLCAGGNFGVGRIHPVLHRRRRLLIGAPNRLLRLSLIHI